MSVEEFIRSLQEYYKPWSSRIMGRMIVEWLRRHPELNLNEFFYMVVAEYPASYDKPVDVAALERTYKQNRKALERANGNYIDEEGNIHRDGLRIGHYDSGRFIPDLSMLQPLPHGVSGYVEHFGNGMVSPGEYADYLKRTLKEKKLIGEKS